MLFSPYSTSVELNCKIETRRLQISVSSWNLIVNVSFVTNHCYMCFCYGALKRLKTLAQPLVTVNQLFHFAGAWFSSRQHLHTGFERWANMYKYLEVYFFFTVWTSVRWEFCNMSLQRLLRFIFNCVFEKYFVTRGLWRNH